MSSSIVARASSLPHVLHEMASILVVDDDPILREFAKVNIATEAVEVEAAADGVEALEMLDGGKFDLLLVDLEMPRMDGFELLTRLRQDARWCHLPVVVITGREDIASIDRAFEAGATTFTVKPLNWRLLSYQLRFVLRSQRAERAAIANRQRLYSSLDNHADLIDELITLCRNTEHVDDLDAHRELQRAMTAHLTNLQSRWRKLG